MTNLTLLIPLVVIVALIFLTQRARRRAVVRQAEQQRSLGPGSRVMTTSGLYGTVVSLGDDDTARLEIAPGVQVSWAVAALRDVATLPAAQRRSAPGGTPDSTPGAVPDGAVPPGAPLDPPAERSAPPMPER